MKSIRDGCNLSNTASILWTLNQTAIIYETRVNVKGLREDAPNHTTD